MQAAAASAIVAALASGFHVPPADARGAAGAVARAQEATRLGMAQRSHEERQDMVGARARTSFEPFRCRAEEMAQRCKRPLARPYPSDATARTRAPRGRARPRARLASGLAGSRVTARVVRAQVAAAALAAAACDNNKLRGAHDDLPSGGGGSGGHGQGFMTPQQRCARPLRPPRPRAAPPPGATRARGHGAAQGDV